MLTTNHVLQQGRYRIIRQFGQDETGVVYEAYDNVLETNVALKETSVSLNKVTTPAQLETLKLAFAGEAKNLTEIRHDSLLNVKDYFSEIDRHYLVTEYVDENNLSDLLEKNQKAFALSDVTDWADQLLDALNYLHTRTPPVIHRDINPRNVKLTADGKVKLIALEVAKNSETDADAANLDAGNLHFLPLEQIWTVLDAASQKVITKSYSDKSERLLKQPPDARSDIYALGATLYHLATARLPIDPLERSIDILDGKADPLAPPHWINPQIPPEISDLIMRALEIKRENRFDSAAIMRQGLRTAFVRMREREAVEAKRQEDALLEIPFAEISEAPDHRKEQRDLEKDAEKARELEMIQQQLREAETQRLLAEQRAAEAEKLLREKAQKDAEVLKSEQKTAEAAKNPAVEKNVKESVEKPVRTETPVEVEKASEQASPADEFNDLFAVPEKNNSNFLRMAAVAAVLLVLSGAGWGIWTMTAAKSASPAPAVSATEPATPAPAPETAPPTTENAALPDAAPSPETGVATETSAEPETNGNAPATPGVRNRPAIAQAAPRATKQAPSAAAQPTPNQKKAVTVDDIINDN